MNDHEPHDRKLLELATSRTLAPHEPLAEGPRELRALWLAMGQTLDEENTDFREADLLARLQARLGAQVALTEPPATPNHSRVWPALLASALALSLLVVLMQSSWFVESSSVAVHSPTTGEALESWSDGNLSWRDELDEELNAAAERVSAVVSSGGVDDSLANLADHLESLSDELSSGSL